jgi:hypothetical protein
MCVTILKFVPLRKGVQDSFYLKSLKGNILCELQYISTSMYCHLLRLPLMDGGYLNHLMEYSLVTAGKCQVELPSTATASFQIIHQSLYHPMQCSLDTSSVVKHS